MEVASDNVTADGQGVDTNLTLFGGEQRVLAALLPGVGRRRQRLYSLEEEVKANR